VATAYATEDPHGRTRSGACYLGYLWPLWDAENRTFTDMILNTRVYKA